MKATINIDREEWAEFIELCGSLGSNGSKEVRKFVDAFKRGEIYEHKNLKPDNKRGTVTRIETEVIANKVAEKLRSDKEWMNSLKTDISTDIQESLQNTMKDSITDMKTDILAELKNSTPIETRNIETDIKKDIQMENTIDSSSTNSSQKTIQTQPRKKTIEENGSSEELILEDWQRPVYLDGEVAKIEGINKSTVNRLRNGKTKGADKTFWNRWELSTLNETKWWRVQGNKSIQKEQNLEKI